MHAFTYPIGGGRKKAQCVLFNDPILSRKPPSPLPQLFCFILSRAGAAAEPKRVLKLESCLRAALRLPKRRCALYQWCALVAQLWVPMFFLYSFVLQDPWWSQTTASFPVPECSGAALQRLCSMTLTAKVRSPWPPVHVWMGRWSTIIYLMWVFSKVSLVFFFLRSAKFSNSPVNNLSVFLL